MINTLMRPRTAFAAFSLAFAVFSSPRPSSASPAVTEISGVVQVMGQTLSQWRLVERTPHSLSPGDRIRTGAAARAVVTLDDGSRMEIGAGASYTLQEAAETGTTVQVAFGRFRFFVNKLLARNFQVRTPTAVCSVRGTEFQVDVLSGGRTTVDVAKGLVGVADMRGNEILLRPDERVSIDFRGMGVPQRAPSQAEQSQARFHSDMKDEVRLDMTKEEVQAAAAREIKLAEFQQGKILLDVSGNRVRLEEYILRPQPDQFKLVVLNERKERLDYFYYLGTFNKALPSDLSAALRQLPGCAGAQCDYFLTRFESGRSNLQDSLFERGLNELGGQVNVNANADPADNVSFLFDSAQDRYVDVTGQPVFQTLFNKYGFYVNNKLKYGWTGGAITSYADTVASSANDPLTGAALTGANAWLDPGTGLLATRSVNVTFPTADKVHQRIYESYSDGSFIQWDNYIIDDQGRIAPIADFGGITSGIAFRRRILDFNYEQVVTSSHFGGRKIDLVVEPKILIQAGLIQ